MIEFIKRHTFKISLLGSLLLLLLLNVIYRTNPERLQPINQVIHAIAAPFQNITNAVQKKTSQWFQKYLILVDVKKENIRLHQKIALMQSELNRYIDDASRFKLLKKQLLLAEQPIPKKVFAEVVGESVDGFHRVVVINKGQRAGIRHNYPVVVVEGLVGRVFSVSANRALVQLLNDPRHRFPVSIQLLTEPYAGEVSPSKGSVSPRINTPQERALAVGRQNKVRAERIRTLAQVKEGDRVVTSGLAGIFPRGLAVGVVGEVTKPKHDVFQYADIITHVDFDNLAGVFILLQPPQEKITSP